MPGAVTDEPTKWWHELRHEGLLISPIVLGEYFPELPELPGWKLQDLRDRFGRLRMEVERCSREGRLGLPSEAVREFVDYLFLDFLGHNRERWLREQQVPSELKIRDPGGQLIRPNRVLAGEDGRPALVVMLDLGRRVGRGRGRHLYASLAMLLQETGVRLGVLTNGLGLRLVYVGAQTEGWVEWDAEEWFEGGEEGRERLRGLMALLSPSAFAPQNRSFRLLEAVEQTRLRQADLAEHLQENVRRAVEDLLECVGEAALRHEGFLEKVRRDPVTGAELDEREVLAALYQAAVRVVMRIVVLLFAEARGLIAPRLAEVPASPGAGAREGPEAAYELYFENYGLEGLWQWFTDRYRRGVGEDWHTRTWAWRRILALFRLIYGGCDLPELQLTAYGGDLFRPGDPKSPDPVVRAVASLESPDLQVTDARVYEILRGLRTGRVRVGSSGAYAAPVDFRQFEAEYIGIIYEGLLDYQLRRAGETLVVLNIGQQPILPLSYLESLPDQGLRELLKELAKESSRATGGEEEKGGEGEDERESEEGAEGLVLSGGDEEGEGETGEEPLSVAEREDEDAARVAAWAQRAVRLLGWVKLPRRKADDHWLVQRETARVARNLVPDGNIIRRGQFYITRSLGIRKGTGTFYTRPALTVPTVRRTLEPLVHLTTPDGSRKLRAPEEILGLKVCDPAMGSGSFLLAALRYLTESLYRAVEEYGCLDASPERKTTILAIPAGASRGRAVVWEEIPALPAEENFRDLLLARLRRHVVERCIYGVDINPVAVELARLALWIETMDPDLPFEFLNHKLKVGNSLVGCWLERVVDYPILAWAREGGDGGDGPQTGLIRRIFSLAKKEMASIVEEQGGQMTLVFDEGKLEAGQISEIVADARERFGELHRTPLQRPEDMERLYQEMRGDPAFAALKQACDRWCAVWFWPVDPERGIDGQALLTPRRFYGPDAEVDGIVAGVAAQHKFFHWELEFPDVFTPERQGFDAILANPPWETMKPISQEFFSEYDPVYRTRGKQEALRKQEELFEHDPRIRQRWLDYRAFYRAMSNWVKYAAEPFATVLPRRGKEKSAHEIWAAARASRQFRLATPEFPFRHQGSADLNSYKLFTEAMWYLLRPGGRMGAILPSGIYSDYGSQELRRLFLEQGRWEWLFVFQNRLQIFPVHGMYKFGPVVVEKGGRTERLRAAFMRQDAREWEERAEEVASVVTPDQIERFSPRSWSIMELKTRREVEICEKIYSDHPLLGSEEWGVEFRAEYHMTGDSRLFRRVAQLESQGYAADGYGRWINRETGDMALPLYEGKMIYHFDFALQAYVGGQGRHARWRDLGWHEKDIRPQFLLLKKDCPEHVGPGALKFAFRDVTNATNERTMVCACIPDMPAGNKVPVGEGAGFGPREVGWLVSAVASLAFDFVVRRRLVGVSLNFYVASELPVLEPGRWLGVVVGAGARLSFVHRLWACQWLELRDVFEGMGVPVKSKPEEWRWQELWAVDLHERVRLRAFLDAVVAELYGLEWEDLEYIICGEGGSFEEGPDESDPVGFWRVDKGHPWEFRHTYLTLVAFRELKEVGLEEFTRWSALPVSWAERMAGGEDVYVWRLPKEAEEYWRGQQGYEWRPREGWEHCELHAHNIRNPFEQVPVEP